MAHATPAPSDVLTCRAGRFASAKLSNVTNQPRDFAELGFTHVLPVVSGLSAANLVEAGLVLLPRVAIPDFTPGILEQRREVIRLVRALPAEARVLFVCIGARGRSPMLVALARTVIDGLAPDGAIAEVRRHGVHLIETDTQLDAIRSSSRGL